MGQIDWTGLAVTMAAAGAVVTLLMAGVLLWVSRTGTVTVIDTVWGAGFACVAAVGLLLSWDDDGNALRVLVTMLTVVWGVRLALHIGRRNRGTGEDARYEDLFARHSGGRLRVATLWVCLPQGAIMWLVSLPVQFAQRSIEVSAWGWALAGLVVWLVGFVFEAVGDAQLRAFRSDPRHRGQVLDRGLWRYTRHPNYFGDACVWWGIFLCAAVTWAGWFTVISPLLMTFLLARGTGKPLMERHLNERPGYREYVARTSGFVPLPPKK